METEMIIGTVEKVLRTDPGAVDADTDLTGEHGASSLDLFTVMTELEELFSVIIDRKRFLRARSVREMAEILSDALL